MAVHTLRVDAAHRSSRASWSTRRWLTVVGAAVLVTLVLTSVGLRAVHDAPDAAAAARCERAVLKAAERRALDTGAGPAVVVIGDSYSVGAGGDPLRSWPVHLPGRVHVDGFSGSGFSDDASPCGAVSYADRAARAVADHPGALVVVEGGLNDHARSDAAIAQGFARLVRELEGHPVLVVGPPPAPDRADEVPRVDAVLRRLATGSGAAYLSMADVELDYLADDLHPSRRGHQQFGRLVATVARLMLRPALSPEP